MGERIVVVCQIGYELNGAVVSRCMANGLWSSGLPRCNPIKCPHPKPLTNGQLIISSTSFKSLVKYTCDSGYQLQGEKTLTNLSNSSGLYYTPCVTLLNGVILVHS